MKAVKNKLLLLICVACTFIITAYILYACGILKVPLSFPINQTQTNTAKVQRMPYVYSPLSALKTQGNSISNDLNQHIIFKGVMIPDPSVLYSTGRLNKELFENIRTTGANIVRLPVHPDLWLQEEDYLEKYIVPAVTWANEQNMYIIIDWHYIGNIQAPDSERVPDIGMTPLELSKKFWTAIADRFQAHPGVIFELCNEPADITPEQWSAAAQELTGLIRSQHHTAHHRRRCTVCSGFILGSSVADN